METSFKKLKKKWYDKLAKSGFVDIEDMDGNLKAEVDPRTVSNAMKTKEARETYYKMAEEFLKTYDAFTDLERQVWREHCTGIGRVRIARNLGISRYRAEVILKRLTRLAGVKK